VADTVWLRPLAMDGSDATVMLPWLTDPRVLEWVYGRNEVYTVDRIRREWNPETLYAENVWPHLIMVGEQPIGYLQLVWAHTANDCYRADGDLTNTYGFDMYIGEPDLWAAGLGTAVCDVAITTLLERGADRVLIDPRVVNERATHVYEKVGFRKVKVLPGNEFHEGVHYDCWLMELDLAAWASRMR
jgi:aminoglycoside 6'-N-acetyltransferase